MIYTVKNSCEELPDMLYDDGARTLYLYTKGTKGNPTMELRQLLQYMERTTEENAANESLMRIQQMVKTVKYDREVSIEFMKIQEREEMLIEQGRAEERANTERERQRADEERVNTEREKQRADEAQRLAELEREKSRRLEEELRKLKSELGQ